jgi:hypothetical protein
MDKTADVLKWYAEERALYEQRIEFEARVIDGKMQRSIAF